MEKIDATTKEGFLEIAQAFGRERAHETRIAQLEALYEQNKDFRWFGERYRRAAFNAKFERDFERTCPDAAEQLRQCGIGY